MIFWKFLGFSKIADFLDFLLKPSKPKKIGKKIKKNKT
jgi:hypothetical protein